MFIVYIWLLLGVFFTFANRKYRITIERDPQKGRLLLNYYVGNYLFQRLRTSLWLLGGERFEVGATRLGDVRYSRRNNAFEVNMVRHRKILLQTSAIQNQTKASQIAAELNAYLRDGSEAKIEVGAAQRWLLLLAIGFFAFAIILAIALQYYERAWQVH